MRASRALLLAAALVLPDDGLRSEDAAKRREALSALLLKARSLPAAEEAKARAALEDLLPREKDEPARALAVRALGMLGGESALAPLLRRMAVEEDPGPQAALLDAFGDLPSAATAAALARTAFGNGEVRERALAAEALGRVAGEESLKALLAMAATTHPWPVQSAVLRGLALRRDPRAADAAVKALRSADPAVRAAAREAAEAILGADHGDDPAAWEKAREAWKPGAAAPADLSAAAPRPETRTTARFFDIPVSGSRVAFVLDCSQSMWGPKSELARAELEAAVKGLRGSQRFGVVLFNDRVWTWRDALVPATPAQKWAFIRTIPELPTKSYTNIHDSLERAFAWEGKGRWAVAEPPGLDEVFFLTDGLPNRGRTRDASQIAEAVRGWNAAGKVRVHTVALGERIDAALLERIASESGGKSTKR